MTTSISSEAQKLWMDIGKNITIEQCQTIIIKLDKIGKSKAVVGQPLRASYTVALLPRLM